MKNSLFVVLSVALLGPRSRLVGDGQHVLVDNAVAATIAQSSPAGFFV